MQERKHGDKQPPICIRLLTSFGVIDTPTEEELEKLLTAARMNDALLSQLMKSAIGAYVDRHGNKSQKVAVRKLNLR